MTRSPLFFLTFLLACLLTVSPGWLAAQNDGGEDVEMEVVAEKNKKKKEKKKKGKKPKKEKEGKEKEEVVEQIENPLCDTTRTYMGELCPRYRTGKLVFIDKNFVGINVKRKKKKEIWVNSTDGNKLKFKINWDDNSCYTLTFLKAKKDVRYRAGDQIYCRIRACHPEPENYCDVDMDHHTVIDYVFMYKPLSNKEVKLKMKKERDLLKKQEEAAWKAKQDSIRRANGEEIEPEEKETPEVTEGGDEDEEVAGKKASGDDGDGGKEEEDKAAAKQAKEEEKARKKAEKEAEKKAKEEAKAAKKKAKEKDGGEDSDGG